MGIVQTSKAKLWPLAIILCLTFIQLPTALGQSCDGVLANRQLIALSEYNRIHPRQYFAHQVKIVDGKGYVKVGLIERSEDARFMHLLFRAIGEGSVAELNAGTIDGPKVLSLLVGLKKLASGPLQTKVYGRVQVGLMLRRQADEVSTGQGANKDNVSAYRWSLQDQLDFENALDVLRVREAASRYFPNVPVQDAGILEFEFDIFHPELITWRLK